VPDILDMAENLVEKLQDYLEHPATAKKRNDADSQKLWDYRYRHIAYRGNRLKQCYHNPNNDTGDKKRRR
jgi:hypothetical protein